MKSRNHNETDGGRPEAAAWMAGPPERLPFGFARVRDTRGPGGAVDPETTVLPPWVARATFDRRWRDEHPVEAARTEYQHPDDPRNSLASRLGEIGGRAWDSMQSSRGGQIFTDATLGGLGTLGAALLLDKLRRRVFGGTPLSWKTKALIGLLGAGAAGIAGQRITKSVKEGSEKRAFDDWTASAERIYQNMVMSALRSDGTLGFSEKTALMKGVAGLNAMDLARLAELVRMAGGAAVGAIVARFLAGKGMMPLLLGGLAGSAIGGAMGGFNHGY